MPNTVRVPEPGPIRKEKPPALVPHRRHDAETLLDLAHDRQPVTRPRRQPTPPHTRRIESRAPIILFVRPVLGHQFFRHVLREIARHLARTLTRTEPTAHANVLRINVALAAPTTTRPPEGTRLFDGHEARNRNV